MAICCQQPILIIPRQRIFMKCARDVEHIKSTDKVIPDRLPTMSADFPIIDILVIEAWELQRTLKRCASLPCYLTMQQPQFTGVLRVRCSPVSE